MYLRILIKDLKRKKTMNFIILLFVVLSSMFLASGMNNIISIATGLERYLDMAGMGGYVALVSEPAVSSPLKGERHSTPFENSLKECSSVTGWRGESVIAVVAGNVIVNGSKMTGFSNSGLVLSPDNDVFRYFDTDNENIDNIPDGKVYITNAVAKRAGLDIGDRINIIINGHSFGLEYIGGCKDACLGSDMMDFPRFLVSRDTFDDMMSVEDILPYHHSVYYIYTGDSGAVENMISNSSGVRFHASRNLIKTSYIVNMLIAGVIMAVSLCLIIIAFVVLRFTIGFSISEEFREIGVMKALGLKNRSIRFLYLVKYLGLAVIGAVIGFAAAFPFGDMLLGSVSENMVISNDYKLAINIISCVIVVGIILLFSWSCTAKIKKLSPVDAVRSGQTGERFGKRASITLSGSKLGANGFLSLNDVLSSPKQTAIITAVFTLCALLVMILSNTAATLSSDKLIYMINVTASDAYYVDNTYAEEIISGQKTLAEVNGEVRSKLAENGLNAKVHNEEFFLTVAAYGDRSTAVRFMWCPDTNADEYYYNEGDAPRSAEEIALAYPAAKEIGAGIGDTVEITFNGKTGKFIITALFDSFNSLGSCGRFHESCELPERSIAQLMAFQIDFEDAPDNEVINERIALMKDIFGSESVFDKAGFVNDCTKAADAVMGVKNMTLIVSLIIIILMTVLIERSFISKERSEIALMKALGFKSRSIINVHILRFIIISAIALVIAMAVSIPMTKLTMDPIFAIMGASCGIEYAVNAPETFLILPVVIFVTVIVGSLITALYTVTVKASDTAAIE